jgi:two-component system NarL family response regulator
MQTISALLVDENPTFLRITTNLLRDYYREELSVVGTSPGYEDALDQVNSLRPEVILLGLDLRNRSGLRLIQRLRAAAPDVAIVVLGPLDMDEHRQEALAAGADAFVAKVSLHADLLPTIRQVMGRALVPRGVTTQTQFSELMLAYALA